MNRMRDIAAEGPRSLGPARKAKTPRKSSKPTRYPPPAPGSLASSTGSPPGSPLDSSETEEPAEPRRTPTGHAELPHAFRPTPSYAVAAAGVVGGGVGACSSSRLEEMKPDHPLGAFYPSQFLWGLAASAEASALGRAATVNVIRGPKVAVLPSSSSSAFDASTGTSSGGSGDECSLSPASVGGKRRHHHHHLQLQQLQLQQQQHLHHHHLHHALSYVDERHHHLAHHHHQQYHQQQQHHQQQEQQHHQQQHHQQQQEQQQQQHTSPLPPPSKRGRFGVPVAPSEEDSMDSAGTGQGAGPRAGPGQQDDDDEDESGGAASLQGSDSKVVQQTRRLLANARERTRVHTISAAFEALRQQVPCYSYGQKLSKLAILRIACSYILALAKLANEDYSGEPGGLSFSECVEQCTRTLQAEGRAKKRKE
ncbi:uncharacterized protein LOC144946538 [Lampetra fluviatilis]